MYSNLKHNYNTDPWCQIFHLHVAPTELFFYINIIYKHIAPMGQILTMNKL
jgi:hypothetical protein